MEAFNKKHKPKHTTKLRYYKEKYGFWKCFLYSKRRVRRSFFGELDFFKRYENGTW